MDFIDLYFANFSDGNPILVYYTDFSPPSILDSQIDPKIKNRG